MGIADSFQIVGFTHAEWATRKVAGTKKAEKSVWRFRKHPDQDDVDAIQELLGKNAEIAAEVQRANEAKAAGQEYTPQMDDMKAISFLRALVKRMSAGWSGPEFELPEGCTYFDPITGDEVEHPLAGQRVPCSDEWMGHIKPHQMREVEAFVADLFGRRSESEAKLFREEPGHPGEPEDGGK